MKPVGRPGRLGLLSLLSLFFSFSLVPGSAGAQSVPDSVGSAPTPLVVFRGLEYGSEAIFSPVTVFLNRGYDVLQARNHPRDIWSFPYHQAGSAIWDALRHPDEAVRRGGGWSRFLRQEILPFTVSFDDARWFPNYVEHLIAGGMTSMMLSDWYAARGAPMPEVLGGVTLMVTALMNETIEARTMTQGPSSSVADLYVFDLGGVFLMRWDPLARFLSQTLQMANWSPMASLTFPSNQLQNNGDYFIYKFPLPFLDRTRLFWRVGLGSQLGFTRTHGDEFAFTVAFGMDTDSHVVDPNTLAETIELVHSAGFFLDRNNSLLASVTLSRRMDERVAVNVYPGVLPWRLKGFGLWVIQPRHGSLRFGIAHRRILGLGLGYVR